MAEKRRKGSEATTAATRSAKKSKKNVEDVAPPKEAVVVTEDAPAPVEAHVEIAKPTKKSRKRAGEILDTEPTSPPAKKGKKSASKVSKESVSLTADGVNGVVEHKGTEQTTIATAKKSKKGSMMAEAEQTQEQELADEFGNDADEGAPVVESDEDNDIDAAPALLTGFDSDNEDPAEDKDFDASRVAPIPQFKKTSKKLRQAKEVKNDGPGVVYVGRVPHGFYEGQMREYFAQFGNISRLRLSRNKKTGASKHFAFIEFESDEVAKIVAETMDNYLMFGHILKCKHAPAGTLHEDVWKGANKKFRKLPIHKLAREKAERPKTEEQITKKLVKEQKRREGKAKKMKTLGYEYDLPELKKPTMIEASEEKQLAIEDKVEGAVVPPADVPKDELAVKVEADAKKTTKPKKSKKAVDPVAVEADQEQKKKAKREAHVEALVVEAEVEVEAAAEPEIKEKPRKAKKVKSGGENDSVETKPAAKDKKLKGILKKSKKA